MVTGVEAERIQLVHDLELLDADPVPSFDALTEIAAAICGQPMCLVSLVDIDRQFFASRVGLDIPETSREVSFCAHAIESDLEDDGVFEIVDTQLDDRFRENDLVLGEPHLRYYAGVSLRPIDHRAVGTLCVLGPSPSSLTDAQRSSLVRLAGVVEQLMRLRLLGIADATLRKRVEQSERYYRYLAEHTADVVFVHDLDGSRTYYSPNMPAFFGYSKEEVDALPPDFRFVHPAERERIFDAAEELNEAHPSTSMRSQAVHKDGTLIDVSVHILAVFENHSAVEFRSSIRDIAGLVESENQLHEANKELVATGKQRSLAVRTIAHDLSAPLAAIRLTSESVLNQLEASPVRGQVENLVDFATHAEALIGDLRVVNDPDASDPSMVFAAHELDVLIERSILQLLGEPSYAGVRLDLDHVVAHVDQHAVSRIVTNLLRNALVHNPAGTQVTIRLRSIEGAAQLEVEDDGKGIPAEERMRMFEPYAALGDQGSGLGLAITRALVQAHGGTVRIDGAEPKGTIVTATFPR